MRWWIPVICFRLWNILVLVSLYFDTLPVQYNQSQKTENYNFRQICQLLKRGIQSSSSDAEKYITVFCPTISYLQLWCGIILQRRRPFDRPYYGRPAYLATSKQLQMNWSSNSERRLTHMGQFLQDRESVCFMSAEKVPTEFWKSLHTLRMMNVFGCFGPLHRKRLAKNRIFHQQIHIWSIGGAV